MDFDNQQLERLRQGETEAFSLLVAHFEGPLYRYLLATAGDTQLANELVVDCFSDFFQALPKMKGNADQLRPFLFSVARNSLRRHWRRQRHALEPLELAEEIASKGPTPSEVVAAQDDHSQLLTALQQLDDITREVFVLRFIEQLSLAEVAKAVGEPLGTVKSRVHRGRQRLESLLKDPSLAESLS